MYQRLLFILTVLCISGAAMAQNVMTPTDGDYIYNPGAASGSLTNPVPAPVGTMQKWVHDPSQKGRIPLADQIKFKSYRFGTLSFRLRFPNNYNPANKYPLVVFLHGAGEAAAAGDPHNAFYANRENQDQLFWGSKTFSDRIDAGEWNGFLFFPQILDNSSQWDNSSFPILNDIMDTLTKYNGLDPDRIIAMGLSAGGFGGPNYAYLHPQRIASVVISNPRFIESLIAPSIINQFLQIPVWMAMGGMDDFPNPAQTGQYRDSLGIRGGDIFQSYYPTQGHFSWNTQWDQRDINDKLILSTYWNAAHKAQPLVYFQNTQFCAGQPISTKMGLTAGYNTYEWQFDGGSGFATIGGATTNIYTATQAGKYRVRFKRTASSAFSDWTPNPVVISTKKCTLDTLFAEHFESTPINDYTTISGGPVFGNSSYFKNNFPCQNGLFVNGSEVFTQDASGRQGGRFMLNNTTGSGSCTYFAGDQVWRTVNDVTVTPNTNYTFSFYLANQSTNPSFNATVPVANITAAINSVNLSPATVQTIGVGNLSWRKYIYTWNSGGSTQAQLAILNNTATGSGNDFAIDEISLVKYTAPAMPGGAIKNTTLWSKANNIQGSDGSPVGVWPNSDINGNSLQQFTIGKEPSLKNNAADNINFNPVVKYNTAANSFDLVTKGFAGVAIHNAAHLYLVMKSNNLSQTSALLREGMASGGVVLAQASGSGIDWFGGSQDPANSLSTPSNTNELNKPILWTLSKNTNNTPSGNKQDIRKNGIIVASKNTGTGFTGNNENLTVGTYNGTDGTFDGSIAEIIYLLDTNLTALSQNKIESYLALKYGTTLGNTGSPINYTASDGTTVFWTGVGNSTYQNDVFGIGTDSLSGLVQAKSNSVNAGSGDGTGQSGKGNLVLATNTELLDKRFLMIGNDAGSLTQHQIVIGEANSIAVGSYRVNRKWKVFNTGSTGAVDLSFDSTGLGNLAGGAVAANYALMIDNDGNGNFSNGTLSFFTATSGSGKKINFSGVVLNNGVVFTLITLKSAALPAVWLGFTAEAVNGNALLNWKTSDEMNVDHYTAEHSFNGVSFSPIGSVTANNSTGVNQYTLTHYNLAPGTHYYRIRRTDKDGKSEYSDTKTVKITTAANVQVRPNPVIGSTLVLAVSVQQSNKTTIQVMGVDGKVLVQQKINLTAGTNLVNLNIATAPPGIYLVQVQLSDEVVTQKFIKQR